MTDDNDDTNGAAFRIGVGGEKECYNCLCNDKNYVSHECLYQKQEGMLREEEKRISRSLKKNESIMDRRVMVSAAPENSFMSQCSVSVHLPLTI